MEDRIKIVDIELSNPPEDIEGLEGYSVLRGLARLQGAPLGYVQVPVSNGRCGAAALREAILEQHGQEIVHHLLRLRLTLPDQPSSNGWRISELFKPPSPQDKDRALFPLVTVAVCTHNRAFDLARCLESLIRLDYPALDILVVDNAPNSNSTEHLVSTSYPSVRYVCELRPGLNWARNRAILEARGEMIAFTDDDAVVDPGWVKCLAKVLAENPQVMAVTGLVVPSELETKAQVFLESYGGFGRGFTRRWVTWETHERQARGGISQFGTGVNMAFRRSLFEEIGGFDPALDVGTLTHGGGDLEIFFRLLKEGHTLVYEPNAIVRHRSRRDYAQLRTQVAHDGIGYFSSLVRSALAYSAERFPILRSGIGRLTWHFRRLLVSFVRPNHVPRDLIFVELIGCIVGLGRYPQARRAALKIAHEMGSLPQAKRFEKPAAPPFQEAPSVGVRTIDLSQPFEALSDVSTFHCVHIYLTWKDRLLGQIEIPNVYHAISKTRLSDTIVEYLGVKLLTAERNLSEDAARLLALAALNQHYLPPDEAGKGMVAEHLRADISVSVVVATRDRPADLRDCLRHLRAQITSRPVEIIVVDNNPASGLTPPVVAEFPHVMLVKEARQGLSYARNAGFIASSGDIMTVVHDDVTMPPCWLEKLVAPFAHPQVMVVTGNVLPMELRTEAQRLFEAYGGLGRGLKRIEADGHWFKSFRSSAVPTWSLGTTANAAFRATLLSDPQIGLMDEELGTSTPTGCGEDLYFFYQVLRAGHKIVYEPSAFVRHKHHSDLAALRRHVFNDSKSRVAYHLATLSRDCDLRALWQLAFPLPARYTGRVLQRLARRNDYSLRLFACELAGYLAGPWSLWQAHRKVQRQGRSGLYIPVSQRSDPAWGADQRNVFGSWPSQL